MAIKFNPFTGNLDEVAGSTPGGSDTQVQFNDGGSFGGSADLTWDDTAKELGVGGDVTLTGRFISSLNGAASEPPGAFTGTWFSGGTSTTTKPQVLIEPTGTTSTAWSTSGTGLGVNAPSGFSGNLLDLQVNGTSQFKVTGSSINLPGGSTILQDRDSSNGIVIGNYAGRHIRLGSATSILFSSASPTSPIDLQIKRDQASVLVVTDGSTGTGYVKQVPVLVSELPAAATVGAGTRGFVSDATSTTFAAAPVGGGANTVPVYSDGTNWLIG